MNYEMLVDVPIKVTVELGRSEMTVQEILNLEKGSVIELNRVAEIRWTCLSMIT